MHRSGIGSGVTVTSPPSPDRMSEIAGYRPASVAMTSGAYSSSQE